MSKKKVLTPRERVEHYFSQTALKRVCEMHETEFLEAYDMEHWIIESRQTDNFYLFKDNGAKVLAVAHLDTVMDHEDRTANFVNTAAGPVIFSGALDDRLGAYTILELLPKLGIQYDILLTVGEESGRSTAQYFTPPEGKEYHWMIEFDRGGTDVVMYQYDDIEMRQLVSDSGARPNDGIFSDISYMEHLEIKGFNWGVGYRDYHGPKSHAFLDDYWKMITYYLKFHENNADTYLPHDQVTQSWQRSYGGGGMWSSDYDDYKPQYKTLEGKAWWDDDERWTEKQWDAYMEGGTDAVLALGRPDADDETDIDIDVILEQADEMMQDHDDLVSDNFDDVNRTLVASSNE